MIEQREVIPQDWMGLGAGSEMRESLPVVASPLHHTFGFSNGIIATVHVGAESRVGPASIRPQPRGRASLRSSLPYVALLDDDLGFRGR